MAIHKVTSSLMSCDIPPVGTTVVNKYKSSYDVYIGRGSIWGNPYTVEEYGREKCIEMYRPYMINRLETEPELLDKLLALDGKRLGCFCKPKPCHGDVLVELINIAKSKLRGQ